MPIAAPRKLRQVSERMNAEYWALARDLVRTWNKHAGVIGSRGKVRK